MRPFLCVLLTFAVGLCLFGATPAHGSDVVTLNGEIFDEVTASGAWFVKFYAPVCIMFAGLCVFLILVCVPLSVTSCTVFNVRCSMCGVSLGRRILPNELN